MSGSNKRGVELLLKATDLTAKPFADVARAVSDLTTKLQAQTEAAGRGEVTTRELSATLRQLSEAGQALTKQAALVDQFQKFSAQLDAARAKATEARSAFNGLKDTIAAGVAPTAAQAREMANLGRAADRADGIASKAQARLAAQAESLERVGIATGELNAAEEARLAIAAQVGASIGQVQAALDNYDSRLRAHRATVQAAAAAEREIVDANAAAGKAVTAAYAAAVTREAAQQKAAATAASAAARQLAEEEAESLRIATRAEKEFAAVDAFKQKLADAKKLREAAGYIRFWEQELAAADKRELEQRDILTRNTAALDAQTKAVERNAGAIRASSAGRGQNAFNTRDTGFLGLKGYELQNLSYQVNDVITQLASGVRITQIAAQQGGQIFQLFERQIGNLISILPQLIVAGVIIGTFAAAMARAANTASAIRQFNAELRVSADGAGYTGERLVQLQRTMQRLGADFDDAGKAIRVFINAGIQQDRLAAFLKLAQEISHTFGTSLPDAAKQLAEAFTGDYEAIVNLDKAYNFLSVAQRAAIRDAFQQTDAIRGRVIAQGALDIKLRESAAIVDGPFTQAWKTAKAAVFDLLDLLANSLLARVAGSTIKFLADRLQDVANGLRVVLDVLPGGGGVRNDPALVQQQLDRLKAERDALAKAPLGAGGPSIASLTGADGKPMTGARLDPAANAAADARTKQLAALDAQIQGLTAHLKTLAPVDAASIDATKQAAEETERRKKAGADFLAQQDREIAAHKGLNDAARAAAKGQEAYNAALKSGADLNSAALARDKATNEERRLIFEEHRQQANSIEQELGSLLATAGKAQTESLEVRLKAIDDQYSAITRRVEDFQRHGGGSINGISIADFNRQMESAKELLKTQETIKFFDTNINELVQERATKFKEVLDAIKEGRTTEAAGYAEATSANAKIGPQIEKMAKDAITFAQALNAAHPSPQLEAFIAKMQTALRTGTGGGSTSAIGQFVNEESAAGLARINQLAAARNDTVKSFNELAAKGRITQREANAEAEKAFKETEPEILANVDAMEQFVAQQRALGNSSAALDLLAAKLKEVRAEAKYINPEFEKLITTIEDSFTNRAVEALDSITDSIGKAIAGTEKWGDTFRDIGVSIAEFFAGFLRDVANAILKEEALALIKTIVASLHEGGVVGQGAGGTTRAANPAWFVGAPRYHSGTVVGLAPDEQAAILQHGEEVLTREDPRNILNMGRAGAKAAPGAMSIRNVLVLDKDLVPSAMTTSQGERVTMTHIRANIPTIRQMLR